ncbi:dihydrodipicolinate synthase family protein [Gilvimarinus sp. F26214L]|uniref:dihydrodipicolinate synthase family protein n=1 Tax=Gilvimarinus sp. DZF01 TaxID=3461371 RepID=UPI00404599E8
MPTTKCLSRCNRREFVGLGLSAGAALLTAPYVTNSLAGEGEHMKPTVNKAWAQQQLRGGEAFVMPSLMPDLKTLDEEGIRQDVRHAIAQGFCSILPLPLGIDAGAERQMQGIIAQEAQGRIHRVGIIRPGPWSTLKGAVQAQEEAGVSHALMYFNPQLASQEAMYEQMREVITNTRLGIVLYAKPSPEITHLDPTGLPLDAFDRLADLDNVIAVKFTQVTRPANAFALAERLGDRLLLGVVDLELMLLLSARYPMQWTGQWGIDSLQSPDTPWVTEFLHLLRRGKQQQAYKLYWQFEPIASAFYALQEPSLSIGGHPWLHIKYMKWLTGGNGGLLPDLKEPPERVPPLDARAREQCREIFARVGIATVDLPDESFVVGNAAYARGVRLKDLPALPHYIT